MDAVEFLEQLKKRSKSNPDYYGEELNIAHIEPISLVSQVEQWAKEHPIKTRQSEFLKMFPNVILNDKGQPSLCAKLLDTTYHRVGGCSLDVDTCQRCMDNFWGQEVEE